MRIAPMRDHVLPLIDDAELRSPIPGLIERVLIEAIHPRLPKRNAREFLQLLTDATPRQRDALANALPGRPRSMREG